MTTTPAIDRGFESRPMLDTTRASIAASVTVLLCVLARVPDRLLQATGLRGWAPALIAVMALVNGARVIAQAPFTVAHRPVSLPRWAAGQVKTFVCTVAVGAASTLPLYSLIRATPAWWLWAWILFAVVTIGGQAAMPVIVRAQTGPLEPADASLARRVNAVAAQAGVDVGHGVRTAGSATTTRPRYNAYVVGMGPSRRVILESGLASWPSDMVDQLVAHEIGHWRLGHAARRLPVAVGAQLATFALAAAVLSSSPLLHWAGVSRAGDPRSYPLLLGLTAALVLPARVLLAGYDRAQERAADRFALTALRAPDSFVAMLDRAARDGGVPRHLPWWRKAVASHPPIEERIRDCRAFARLATSEGGRPQ